MEYTVQGRSSERTYPLLNLAETLNAEEVPNISYHCKCRQLFTMKRDIDQINKTNHNSDSIDENERTPKRLCTRSTHYTISSKTEESAIMCIFCHSGKSSKYISGTRTR